MYLKGDAKLRLICWFAKRIDDGSDIIAANQHKHTFNRRRSNDSNDVILKDTRVNANDCTRQVGLGRCRAVVVMRRRTGVTEEIRLEIIYPQKNILIMHT